MKIEWNRVTWYSKLVAVIVFGATAWVFFSLGAIYGQATGEMSLVTPPAATPTTPISTTGNTQQQGTTGPTVSGSPSKPSPSSVGAPAASTITFVAPAADAQWTFNDQHTIQWSKASGSPGTITLLDATTGAVVGWIQQQILGTQNTFTWNTRDVFVSKVSPQTANIAPGRYRIAISFLSPRDPEIVSSVFSVVVLPSTINIQNAVFTPASTTITAGTKLTFVNHDAANYTLSITSKGTFTVGASASTVYDTAILTRGTYTFYSTAYPALSLTVIVK
jgi:plastocyanin